MKTDELICLIASILIGFFVLSGFGLMFLSDREIKGSWEKCYTCQSCGFSKRVKAPICKQCGEIGSFYVNSRRRIYSYKRMSFCSTKHWEYKEKEGYNEGVHRR